MGGDWNSVIRIQDVSPVVAGPHFYIDSNPINNQSYYRQKKSKELSTLIKNFQYQDAFLLTGNLVDFTWIRPGLRPSRLDRFYVPPALKSLTLSVQHILHLSDHKAVIVQLHASFWTRKIVHEKPSSNSYWKLNAKILDDVNFGLSRF